MATSAPPDPGLAAVESSAANALASALSAEEAPASSPSPETAAAPPPAATPSAEAPTPAAPTQAPPAGQATAPITIDPNGLSPEARRALQMEGGNVQRALERYLEFNNRLAAATRPGEPPAPGAAVPPPAPGTAPATAPPATPAPPAPPAVATAPPDQQAIEKEIDQLTGADQECVRLAQQFGQAVEQVQALDAKYGGEKKLNADIQYYERRLQDTDVKGDEVAEANIKETLRELKEARAERRDIVRNAREDEAAYNARAEAYGQRITARQQAKRARAEADAQVERHANELSVAWKPGIQRAVTDNKIPAALAERFEDFSRRGALANLELGFSVEDLSAFLNAQAKEFLEVVELAHREKSAEYGNLARARAEQPGPAPGQSVATAQVPQSGDLNEVYKLTRLRLEGKL